MVNAVGKAPPEVLAQHEFLNAVKNIAFPYYTPASSCSARRAPRRRAAASGASAEQQLAGHAATLLVPTLHLLRAAEKGGQATVGSAPVHRAGQARRGRGGAPRRLLPARGARDAARGGARPARALVDRQAARDRAGHLRRRGHHARQPHPLRHRQDGQGIGGQRHPRTWRPSPRRRPTWAARSRSSTWAAARRATRTGSTTTLSSSTSRARTRSGRASRRVRSGAATTQWVLAKPANRVSGAISAAGATPRDLVTEEYAAVPLVVANGETAKILDYASVEAAADVMPPRPAGMRLDAHQVGQLHREPRRARGARRRAQHRRGRGRPATRWPTSSRTTRSSTTRPPSSTFATGSRRWPSRGPSTRSTIAGDGARTHDGRAGGQAGRHQRVYSRVSALASETRTTVACRRHRGGTGLDVVSHVQHSIHFERLVTGAVARPTHSARASRWRAQRPVDRVERPDPG